MKRISVLILLAASTCVASDDGAFIERYVDYRSLTRITPAKIDVVERPTTICRDPRFFSGPHFKPGLHIYVNDRALVAANSVSPTITFPIGSLIVKEKFEKKDDAEPSLITVMEKIGDAGGVDDWRFVMIRLPERTIVRERFEVSCTDCHTRFKGSGFVSTVTTSLLREFAKKQAIPSAAEKRESVP